MDSHGGFISISLAFLVRLLQCVVISLLIFTSAMIESLEVLFGRNISWWLIFLILSGLVGLGYLIFSKSVKHLPLLATVNERIVVPRAKSILQNGEDEWSVQKAFSFKLNKGESLIAVIGLVLLTGLPYANEFFGEYIDNKAGVVRATILYAVKDIPEGTTITEDEIEVRMLPEHRIPSDALRSIDAASGRIAKYGILAGQIVSLHDISSLKKQPANKKPGQQ